MKTAIVNPRKAKDREHLVSLGFDPDRSIKHTAIGSSWLLSQEVNPTIEEGAEACESKEMKPEELAQAPEAAPQTQEQPAGQPQP